MGNTESVVVQKRLTRFRPDERPVVEGVFEQLQAGSAGAAGKPGKALTVDMLKASMGSIASDSTIMRVYAGMTSIDAEAPPAPGGGVSREQLVIFLADTLRGTAEERAPLVMAMAQQGGKGAMATVDQIKQFLEDLISAAVQILDHRGRLRGWKPEHMGDGTRGVKLLAEQLSSEIKASDQQTCDTACLEDWLFRVSSVAVYLELLVSEGLSVTLPSRPPPTLLPLCREPPWGQLRTSLLDVPLLLFLAPLLPTGTSAPWRLLFSTHLHGESFTRLVSGCKGRGPTVLLLRDTKGHVFGGFASHSWEIRPQFQGDSRCFLFSVSPCMRVYTCTGYNQHYMYLNQGQQTMPNGLGMGGQHGYFGLWLDSDFGRGHSRARPKCTTYGSPQLSAEEDFSVDALELWAVSEPPEQEQDENKRSILDVDPEVQAMMEMAGKTLHSQGLREPEEDEQ
ncbi:MTOR-associated protein MEAK7 isoform X1 [Alosa pseudoharengus]|uniref:MTOR-associated protein MEAK7 isoform X1 n=1 Tax=Alosa pseudoharengus TaxID=34774 RepID=UPI003F8A520E